MSQNKRSSCSREHFEGLYRGIKANAKSGNCALAEKLWDKYIFDVEWCFEVVGRKKTILATGGPKRNLIHPVVKQCKRRAQRIRYGARGNR